MIIIFLWKKKTLKVCYQSVMGRIFTNRKKNHLFLKAEFFCERGLLLFASIRRVSIPYHWSSATQGSIPPMKACMHMYVWIFPLPDICTIHYLAALMKALASPTKALTTTNKGWSAWGCWQNNTWEGGRYESEEYGSRHQNHPSELGKAHSIRPLVIHFSGLKSIPVSDRLSETSKCPFWERKEPFR